MGLFMDILEQNLEGHGWIYYDYPLPTTSGRRASLPQVPERPLIFCPVGECNKVFHLEEELRRHLLSAHTNQFAYLIVNGRIVRNEALFSEPCKSIELVIHGFKEGEISVFQDQGGRIVVPFEHRCNISDTLPNKSAEVTTIHVKLAGDHKTRIYTLFNLNQKKFVATDIDRDAFNMLFVPLNDGKKPLFGDFLTRNMGPRMPLISQKYAEGLFDYANAFLMSSQGEAPMAKGHFESALSRLCNYRSALAITATRVLALRMNVFGLLFDAAPPSVFAEANNFFNDSQPEKRSGIECPTRRAGEIGVYYDDETEILLEAISAYYAEDFLECGRLAAELRRISKDANNISKMTLIEARAAARSGNSALAVQFYQALEFHPDFGEEAERILKSGVDDDRSE